MAAILLFGLAITLAYRGRHGTMIDDALVRAAVGDHRNCAIRFRLTETPVGLSEAATRYGGWYRVLETAPADDMPTAAGPAHVLERHACVYNGRRFAHIVMQYHDERVSMLVAARDSGGDGVSVRTPPAIAGARRIDETTVASIRTSRYDTFLVGDVDPADLTTLAEAVAAPLHAGLEATPST
jgi:hypothetical protein